jgi:hypothetical protein
MNMYFAAQTMMKATMKVVTPTKQARRALLLEINASPPETPANKAAIKTAKGIANMFAPSFPKVVTA